MAKGTISQSEPSMDELLASIREIIEESSAAAAEEEYAHTAASMKDDTPAILTAGLNDKPPFEKTPTPSPVNTSQPLHDAMQALAARIGLKNQKKTAPQTMKTLNTPPEVATSALPQPANPQAISLGSPTSLGIGFSTNAPLARFPDAQHLAVSAPYPVPTSLRPQADPILPSQVNENSKRDLTPPLPGVSVSPAPPVVPSFNNQRSETIIEISMPQPKGQVISSNEHWGQTLLPSSQSPAIASAPASPVTVPTISSVSSPTVFMKKRPNNAQPVDNSAIGLPKVRNQPAVPPESITLSPQFRPLTPNPISAQPAPNKQISATPSPQTPLTLSHPNQIFPSSVVPSSAPMQEERELSDWEKDSLAEFEQSAELLLRPYIANWLEEHFHHLFEKILREEIQRLMKKNLHKQKT